MRFAEPPGQIEVLVPALTIGNGLTVTTTLSVLIQPWASVPVTIYFVVVDGFAAGEATTADESPLAGLHT